MDRVLDHVARPDDIGRHAHHRSLVVTLSIIPVHGLPEVRPKDDLVGLLLTALDSARDKLVDGDVLVVAQKVVSQSEGRLVRPAANAGVDITAPCGPAWREGHTNGAIAVAGRPAVKRYIGQRDPEGYELRVTEIAVADEIAAAAELVMGKLDRCPVAIVRGLTFEDSDETAQEYVRPAARDMFR